MLLRDARRSVVCAQGATARSTSRTDKGGAKSLIKSGQSQMRIEMHVANEGSNAYQPENFGDTIILERSITMSVCALATPFI